MKQNKIKVVKNCSQFITYLNNILKLSDPVQRMLSNKLIENKIVEYKGITFFYDPYNLLD